MRTAIPIVLLLVAATLPTATSALAASGDCDAPPCGPIPVIITILCEKSRGVTFDDSNKFTTPCIVQYYFDIDQNGVAYDPAKEMKVTLKVNKQPPWVKTTIEPTSFIVPLRPDQCPACTTTEGDAQNQQYIYEHKVSVTVDKLKDPTPEELKKWTKSDKTYRVTFSAISNDSMVGTDPTGRPAGLMEGYGVKEIRFDIYAEPAIRSASPVQPEANAPGLGLWAVVVALLAGVFAARRRR